MVKIYTGEGDTIKGERIIGEARKYLISRSLLNPVDTKPRGLFKG